MTDHSPRNITQNGNEQTDEQTSKAKNEKNEWLDILTKFLTLVTSRVLFSAVLAAL